MAGNDNPFLLPIGEIEALTANTGIARTASSANALYNPAGIAYIKDRRLTVSGSTYAIVRAEFETGEQNEEPLRFNTFSASPNMVVSSKELGGRNIVYGLFVPTALEINAKFVRPTTIGPGGEMRIALASKSSEQFLGLGTGRFIGENWSAGASLFGHRFNESEVSSAVVTINGGTPNITSSKRVELEVISLIAVFGIHHKVSDNFQWGVRFSPPSLQIQDKAEVYKQEIVENGGVVTRSLEEKTTSAKYPFPWSVGLGMNFYLSGRHSVSAEVSVQGPERFNTIPSSAMGDQTRLGTTVRGQLAYEYKLRDPVQILTGINWNPSTVQRRIDANGEEGAPLHFLGFTSGIYYTDDNVKTGAGVFYLNSRTDRYFFGPEPDNQTSINVMGLLISSSIQY